jgi:DNA invertase Pin-like site-specific DNA recombinase
MKTNKSPDAAPGQAVSYLRVSTLKQGADGLGIEAQRSMIARAAKERGLGIAREFVEVESGGNIHRPILAEALALARKNGWELVVAKQDRLSRDAAHAITLLNGNRIVCADAPHDSQLSRGVKAVVNHEEKERIAQRTREALTELKKRLAALKPGETLMSKRNRPFAKLGAPQLAAAQRKGWEARSSAADSFALGLRPILADVIQRGRVGSAAMIAQALNARGVATGTKRAPGQAPAQWHHGSVRNVLSRLERLGQGVALA